MSQPKPSITVRTKNATDIDHASIPGLLQCKIDFEIHNKKSVIEVKWSDKLTLNFMPVCLTPELLQSLSFLTGYIHIETVRDIMSEKF